jgi:hypothetical protein
MTARNLELLKRLREQAHTEELDLGPEECEALDAAIAAGETMTQQPAEAAKPKGRGRPTDTQE